MPPAVEETRLIGINILSEDNGSLMKPFTQSSNPEPFADLSLLPNEHRLPQLTDAEREKLRALRQKRQERELSADEKPPARAADEAAPAGDAPQP